MTNHMIKIIELSAKHLKYSLKHEFSTYKKSIFTNFKRDKTKYEVVKPLRWRSLEFKEGVPEQRRY